MNKDDFLQHLFSLYPNTFTEKNLRTWHKAYSIVFGNKKIDFNKLFEVYVTSYQSTAIAPAPAWFKEHLSDCIIRPDKCAALVHIDKIREEGSVPPPKEFKEAIKNLIAKTAIE